MASREWMDDPIIAKVRRAAMANGNNGVRELTQSFRRMDVNKDAVLSPEELRAGLRQWGVNLREDELRYIVTAFDRNKDGQIGLTEFLEGIRGGLNPRRRAIVKKAFMSFDADGDGNITLDELRKRYDVSYHPAVLKKEKTPEEVLQDFIENFDDKNNPDGRISWEEFEAFYTGVGVNIDDDDYFEMMIIETFGLEDEGRPRFAPEKREYDVYGDSVAPDHPVTAAEIYSRSVQGGINDRNYDVSHMKGGRSANPSVQNKFLPHTWETTQRADYGYYDRIVVAKSKPPKIGDHVAPPKFSPTGDPVLDKVRWKILNRAGKRGFKGLARILRNMDDNGNKKLSLEELKSGFQTYQMGVTARELETIFAYFDRNGDGSISVTEFVRGVRGPMQNPHRLELVEMAFKRLDKTGDGVVNLEDMLQAYDVNNHPEVKSGEKSKEEVYHEFMEDWDLNRDGRVTLEEFIDYYGNLSAGIDDDRYFELMIRNAWHISGGTGVAANTSCRRVLVIFMDGTQKVMEIKDDLGIAHDDIPRMMDNLKRQGIKNIKRIQLSF